MSNGSMTSAEREEFLAGVHVGIIAIEEPGRGPLALPVWYLYRDGYVDVFMDANSVKVRLARAAGRATLTVQDERPPYKYVSVEGPVEVLTVEESILETAVRYLGPEFGAAYAANSGETDGSTLVRLRPKHWRTIDYAKVGD